MTQIMHWFSLDPKWVWALSVFIIILLTGIISLLTKAFLRILMKQLNKTKTKWDDILLGSALRPLNWLVWVIGVTYASDIIYSATQSSIFTLSELIREVGIFSCLLWFLLRLIKNVEHSITENKDIDKHTVEAIGKLIRMSVIITGALVILQTLGYSISGVLAFGGVGGIAIGFAAKDLLANFFGGLIIYLDRPFKVGDWVSSPDRQIEGTVEKIGWRMTIIRSFKKRPLYVPNSVFSSIVVENPSRMSNRRIYETIGIRYEDIHHMNAIVDAVKTMLKKHNDIDSHQTMIVNFNQFSASSVDFFIYTFTKTTDWVLFHSIKQDVLLKVSDIIEKNHAEIAFPTQTILLPVEDDMEGK